MTPPPRVPSPDEPRDTARGGRRLLWIVVALLVVLGFVLVYAPGCWNT